MIKKTHAKSTLYVGDMNFQKNLEKKVPLPPLHTTSCCDNNGVTCHE